MTWMPCLIPTICEYLLDHAGRATGHEIQRGTITGVYSGSWRGEPVGRSSMEIYTVRKALEAHARGMK